ncbi:MAG: Fic family protein [Planctomycetota bacterium]
MSELDRFPWLSFFLDLERFPYYLWMLLGEARSKCDHIAGVPLLPETAERLHLVYLAKGALATTAIEGNTLSEEEVRRHLDGALELPPSKEYLKQEIENVVAACNHVWKQVVHERDPNLTRVKIESYNGMVLRDLPLQEEVVPGEIRRHRVGVARYRAVPPEECEELLDRLCEWLASREFNDPDLGLSLQIVKAIVAHLYLAWIHPFGDGNGRTARLVEFHILIAAGVPSPVAHLLSNHYNVTRSEYYRLLDASSRSGGDVVPFVTYAVQGLVDGLTEQIGEIRRQQTDVLWEAHVHRQFDEHDTAVGKRRRQLILELSKVGEPVRIADVRYRTPGISRLYEDKGDRTVTRDLELLVEMGLLRSAEDGLVACKELILAMLPAKAGE